MSSNHKTALITGGSRGIGLATALRFARTDWNIAIAARSEEDLQAAAAQIREAGATCEVIAADVGELSEAQRVLTAVTARFGRLDVLVNNAGYAPVAPVDEMSDEDYRKSMTANLDATFYMTRGVWPLMTQQGGGVIVNLSSVASVDPFPGFAVYGACKAWVNVFTRATADAGKKVGIRVYAVAPGATETQMLRGAFPDFPSKDTLKPDDIAAVIETLCDERMAYSVGQTVFVKK